jgi:hypothetical protein
MNRIEKNFEMYKNRNDSDYEILIDGQAILTSTFVVDEAKRKQFDVIGNNIIISEKLAKDLSPDTVDSREFWYHATKHFPLFSVCGVKPESETIDNVNKTTLSMAHKLNAIGSVKLYFDYNPKAKLLEIGPGHGGFQKFITSIMDDKNYYAIDVNPLFVHPRLHQTTGDTIPNKIPKVLNIVYSYNVFQHLSKKQRTNYYKRIHKRLSQDGVFIFGMFLKNAENATWPVWNYYDKSGRSYVQFFGQFTEVDTQEELYKELSEIGFEVKDVTPAEFKTHYRTLVCFKK